MEHINKFIILLAVLIVGKKAKRYFLSCYIDRKNNSFNEIKLMKRKFDRLRKSYSPHRVQSAQLVIHEIRMRYLNRMINFVQTLDPIY